MGDLHITIYSRRFVIFHGSSNEESSAVLAFYRREYRIYTRCPLCHKDLDDGAAILAGATQTYLSCCYCMEVVSDVLLTKFCINGVFLRIKSKKKRHTRVQLRLCSRCSSPRGDCRGIYLWRSVWKLIQRGFLAVDFPLWTFLGRLWGRRCVSWAQELREAWCAGRPIDVIFYGFANILTIAELISLPLRV